MLCSRYMIQAKNCSRSVARSFGSRSSLPGITTFTRILLESGLFESSTLPNGLFTRTRTQLTAFRILHTVEACHGHEKLL